MATLATTHPTLLDWTRRLDPDGQIDTIAELLNESNPILDDMVWMEGNLPTGHRTTIRTGLPTPTWRKLYGGVQPTKSTTAQVTDTTGMLEAYAEVDKALADLNGNTAAFRLSEDRAHIEGMSQEHADTLFFGDTTTAPEEFHGLDVRYNDTTAENGENILLESAGNGTHSIWLIGWGMNQLHGIFPKGSRAGLQVNDKGQVTIEDASDGSNSGRMEAYRTHYRWDCGLTVRDWRFAVRIQYVQANLTADAATGADLIDLMTQALELPPNLTTARFSWYLNRTAMSFLRRQHVNAVSNSTLSFDIIDGRRVTSFGGFPLRRTDALEATETSIS